MKASKKGFTLIELVVVMGLMGLLLMMVVPRMDGLMPKYALQGAARDIAAHIDMARSASIGRGVRVALFYRIDDGTYQLFAPGLEEDGPGEGPWDLHPVGPPEELPKGVRFRGIQPMGIDYMDSGELAVRFDPLAIDGSHIVVLENDQGTIVSVKYNAIIGISDFVDGEAQFAGNSG